MEEEDKYCDFENLCFNGSYKQLEDFMIKNNIDVNYNDGDFFRTICGRNDIEIIKVLDLFIKYGGNIHINDETVLSYVSECGLLDIIKYLVEKHRCDFTKLKGTSSYSNYKEVENYFKSFVS